MYDPCQLDEEAPLQFHGSSAPEEAMQLLGGGNPIRRRLIGEDLADEP